jgi:hypothetical protein
LLRNRPGKIGKTDKTRILEKLKKKFFPDMAIRDWCIQSMYDLRSMVYCRKITQTPYYNVRSIPVFAPS